MADLPLLAFQLLDMIEDQSNLLAKQMLKGFIFNIAVRDFDLGPHPPRITSIQVFPEASGEDSLLMDVTLSMIAPAQLLGSDNSRLGLHMVISMVWFSRFLKEDLGPFRTKSNKFPFTVPCRTPALASSAL